MSFTIALQKYIDNPDDPSVLYCDDDVVIIADKFPKLLRHYLVLPRDPVISKTHPLEVFREWPDKYEKYAYYVEKAKDMIVESLVGENLVSSDDRARQLFRASFIRAGVHSIPSMANLHIHVITQDFYLSRMKNKKHYNSFTTSFFVDFADLDPEWTYSRTSDFLIPMGVLSGSSDEDYNLEESETPLTVRRPKEKQLVRDPGVLSKIIRDTPLACVYCQRKYGNSFAKLKEHLANEYKRKFLAGESDV